MKRLDSSQASSTQTGHACFMLTELYIDALLVDEELAAWDVGDVDDLLACLAWLGITSCSRR